MLVLTRQRDQTIIIGDDIQITVVDVRGDKVRLGITAPREVPVYRKEIYDDIKRQGHRPVQSNALRQTAGSLLPGRVQSAADDGQSSAPPASTSHAAPAHVLPPPVSGVADDFLRAALAEARLGMKEGGLPIGAVLARGGQIVAAGHNRRVQNGDPMAHAEIDCLTRAGRQQTYRDTVLYSTLMPCWLCSGAVLQFGIPKVVVGESVNFPGAADLLRRNHVEVVDLHDPQCISLMGDFIRQHPDLWHEDIGK